MHIGTSLYVVCIYLTAKRTWCINTNGYDKSGVWRPQTVWCWWVSILEYKCFSDYSQACLPLYISINPTVDLIDQVASYSQMQWIWLQDNLYIVPLIAGWSYTINLKTFQLITVLDFVILVCKTIQAWFQPEAGCNERIVFITRRFSHIGDCEFHWPYGYRYHLDQSSKETRQSSSQNDTLLVLKSKVHALSRCIEAMLCGLLFFFHRFPATQFLSFLTFKFRSKCLEAVNTDAEIPVQRLMELHINDHER